MDLAFVMNTLCPCLLLSRLSLCPYSPVAPSRAVYVCQISPLLIHDIDVIVPTSYACCEVTWDHILGVGPGTWQVLAVFSLNGIWAVSGKNWETG